MFRTFGREEQLEALAAIARVVSEEPPPRCEAADWVSEVSVVFLQGLQHRHAGAAAGPHAPPPRSNAMMGVAAAAAAAAAASAPPPAPPFAFRPPAAAAHHPMAVPASLPGPMGAYTAPPTTAAPSSAPFAFAAATQPQPSSVAMMSVGGGGGGGGGHGAGAGLGALPSWVRVVPDPQAPPSQTPSEMREAGYELDGYDY